MNSYSVCFLQHTMVKKLVPVTALSNNSLLSARR